MSLTGVPERQEIVLSLWHLHFGQIRNTICPAVAQLHILPEAPLNMNAIGRAEVP